MYYFEDQVRRRQGSRDPRRARSPYRGSRALPGEGPGRARNAERFLSVGPWTRHHGRGRAASAFCAPRRPSIPRVALADRYGAPISFTFGVADELRTSEDRYGNTSTEHLATSSSSQGVLVAHGVWLSRATGDPQGGRVAWPTPQSNRSSVGRGPLSRLLRGIRWARTDGAATNDARHARMDSAAMLAKHATATHRRTRARCREATLGGARPWH